MILALVGSTGQLARDLQTAADERGIPWIGLTHSDIEVADWQSVKQSLGPLECSHLVNCAAFHDVVACEHDRQKAFSVNSMGSFHLAKFAKARDWTYVYYSTDYVFDGIDRGAGQPYGESDIPNPVNYYGWSKLCGEKAAQVSGSHLILRTTGLYGLPPSSKGLKFPDARLKQVEAGETIQMVSDVVCSPTLTHDLARGTLDLLQEGATGLFHLTNDGECSWYEFTMTLLEIIGLANHPVEVVESSGGLDGVRRPKYTALSSERLCELPIKRLRSWSDALQWYLAQEGVTNINK